MQCIASASARSFGHIFRVNSTRYTRSAYCTAAAIAQETPTPRVHYELTGAQASRAASAVVRHFCSTGELRNAYFVINTLRSTSPSATKFSRSIPSDTLHNLLNDRDTLDLGNLKVNPRLASHSLLHGLVRLGLSKKAAMLAQMMMEDGIRIRTHTFQTIIQSLAQTPPPPTFTQLKAHFNNSHPNHVLQLHSRQIGNIYLNFATELLLNARQYRQRRTKEMFGTLIRACILQGEILVGSLLLVLAIKDWQLRTAQQKAMNELGSEGPELEDAPCPPQAAMNQLLNSIEQGLRSNNEEMRQSCAQGLANLASLLEEQSLPFAQIAPLLRALVRYPPHPYEVWISPDSESHLRINAHKYFNRVLLHTASHLPSKAKKKKHKDANRILPLFDIQAYNTILNYALHRRKDVPLARGILRHMKLQGRNPDQVTEAIVFRAETAHGRPLHLLRANAEGSSLPAANPHTVAPYVTLLAEAGRSDSISALLLQLLPELTIIPHPSCPRPSTSTHLSREKALKQAVALGPYFYTSLLNALRKAQQPGLAERVWFLAKEAERASWCIGGEGWCLPLPAYTSMLQCYSYGMRRSLTDLSKTDENVRVEVKNKRYTKGWAKFVLMRRKIRARRLSSRETAHLIALERNRSLKEGARGIFLSMMRMQSSTSSTTPKPDARFFNALLYIFTKPPYSRKHRPPSHYRRHLRAAEAYYARFWIKSAYWHPFLKELAEAMRQYGYDVPLGLRYLFVGRYPPAVQGGNCEPGKFEPFRLGDEKSRGIGPRKRRKPMSKRRPRNLLP